MCELNVFYEWYAFLEWSNRRHRSCYKIYTRLYHSPGHCFDAIIRGVGEYIYRKETYHPDDAGNYATRGSSACFIYLGDIHGVFIDLQTSTKERDENPDLNSEIYMQLVDRRQRKYQQHDGHDYVRHADISVRRHDISTLSPRNCLVPREGDRRTYPSCNANSRHKIKNDQDTGRVGGDAIFSGSEDFQVKT